MKKLVIYLMAEPETPELARAAVDGGADIVELGFPFSDPLADGPVIRRAGERALARGMRTRACLDVSRADARARARHAARPDDVLVAARGVRLGALRRPTCTRAGGASMIVADLPAGERPELRRVQLVAPTSTDERIALAGEQTDGWLYLVTVTGTTGARGDVSPALAGLVERARRLVDVPLYAGFGISTPEHARRGGGARRRHRRRLARRRGRRGGPGRAARVRASSARGARLVGTLSAPAHSIFIVRPHW